MRSKYEIRAQQELQAEGYTTDYKIRPSKFVPRGYKVDFFGCFDLIAYKPGEPFVRWISIKGMAGNRGANKEEIKLIVLPEGNQREIWWVNDVGVWRKEIILAPASSKPE